MSVFAAAINLIVFMRNLSYFRFGLYVVMLIEIAATFLVVLPLLVFLLLAFALGIYFGYNTNFDILFNSLLEFLFGNQGIYVTIWNETDMYSLRILSILFFWIMLLLLMNFLIGLAVKDIEGIRKSAEITLFSIRAETVYSNFYFLIFYLIILFYFFLDFLFQFNSKNKNKNKKSLIQCPV